MSIIVRFVAVAWYHDGSGLLGAYGPWDDRPTAEEEVAQLQRMGVHTNDEWTILECWGDE